MPAQEAIHPIFSRTPACNIAARAGGGGILSGAQVWKERRHQAFRSRGAEPGKYFPWAPAGGKKSGRLIFATTPRKATARCFFFWHLAVSNFQSNPEIKTSGREVDS